MRRFLTPAGWVVFSLVAFWALVVLAWAIFNADEAHSQTVTYENFGATVAPGLHASKHGPNSFVFSENMFALQDSRMTRWGLARASSNTLPNAPVLFVESFWAESDSLYVVVFCNGSYYYSKYGSVSYTASNWYDLKPWGVQSTTLGTGDTLTSLTRIESFTADSATKSADFVFSTEDSCHLIVHAAPGDSIYFDTATAGTLWLFIGIVERVIDDDWLVVDRNVGTLGGKYPFRMVRAFSSIGMPWGQVINGRLYVTNGRDPMQVIYDTLGELCIRANNIAEVMYVSDLSATFKDTASSFISKFDTAGVPCSTTTRFLRFYDYSKAWAVGEWSGLGDALTGTYFLKWGKIGSGVRANQIIAPIIYNDEQSLIVALPAIGDSIGLADSLDFSPRTGYSGYPANSESSDTATNNAWKTQMKGHRAYILSAAGALRVVDPNTANASAISRKGGAVWKVIDTSVSTRFEDNDFSGGIYFFHDLSDKATETESFTSGWTWKYITSPIPPNVGLGPQFAEAWELVDQKWGYWGYSESSPDGYRWLYTYRYRVTVERPRLTISGGYYHIRAVEVNVDTAFFITSHEPATLATADVQSTKWEIVKADVPYFSGIEKADEGLGLIGWGDSLAPGVFSRCALTIRGPEPWNWNAAFDVALRPNDDAITAIAAFDDQEFFFTRNSTTAGNPRGEDFALKEVANGIGCVAPRSIVKDNKFLYFMAEHGFYRIQRRDFSGWSLMDISGQMDLVFNPHNRAGFAGHDGTQKKIREDRKALTIARYIKPDDRIWVYFAEGSSNYPNYAATYYPKAEVWDGFQDVDCGSITSLDIRDTQYTLIGSPSTGKLVWYGRAASDTGVAITSRITGALYSPFGDSLLSSPASAWLTYSADTYDSTANDTLRLIFSNIRLEAGGDFADTVIVARLPEWSVYTDSKDMVFHDLGDSRYWLWDLIYKGDAAKSRRWIQPVKMTVNFTVGKVGQ